MKITYDAATDTLSVVLRDAPARISEEAKSGVILDYDADERLIAIEVIDASTRVDGVDTVQLQVTPSPASNDQRRNEPRFSCRLSSFGFLPVAPPLPCPARQRNGAGAARGHGRSPLDRARRAASVSNA